MPVHAIRVETSKLSSGTPLPTVVGNLLSGLSTVLPEEASEFSLYEPTPDEPLQESYRAGLWRFDAGDHGADELVKTFENSLRGPAKWARIRYHTCNHDLPADERGPCSWDDSKAVLVGNVPNELPGPTSEGDLPA